MSQRISDEELGWLAEMEVKATAGKWENTPMLTVVTDNPNLEFDGIPIVIQNGRGDSWSKDVDADCRFIAAFRNALPALIEEVRESRKARAEIRISLERDGSFGFDSENFKKWWEAK